MTQYVDDNLYTRSLGIGGAKVYSLIEMDGGEVNILVADQAGRIRGPYVVRADQILNEKPQKEQGGQ